MHQAQAEVDRLAALPYGELALTSAPLSSSDPQDPGYKVSRKQLRGALRPERAAGARPRRRARRPRWSRGRRISRSAPAAATIVGDPSPLRHLARRELPAAALRGRAEHQARDRRGDARSRCPEPPPGRPCGSRPSWWTPTPRRPGPRRRPVAAPGAATRSPPTRSTSTTLPADRARGSPRAAATPRGTRPRRGPTAADNSTCEHPEPDHQPDLMGGSAPPGDSNTPRLRVLGRPRGRLPGRARDGQRRHDAASTRIPAAEAAGPAGPEQVERPRVEHRGDAAALPARRTGHGLAVHVHARRSIGQWAPVRHARSTAP